MSWDASDEDTWDRWERQSRARRAAGAVGNGRGGVAGESTDAAVPVRKQDRRLDPESLHPSSGLYDAYPHEED